MNRLLDINPSDFKTHFAASPFTLAHSLTSHPLLSVERIARLADALPLTQVEHNVGDVPELLPDGEAPRSDAAPGDIARSIETNGCWMVLKNIEADPDYADLLNQTLDEVLPLVVEAEGGMQGREGFIFLSAPNSTTPAHIDPEHNFLLQVRGAKTMVVGDFPDRRSEQLELERYYSGGHRNIAWMFDDAAREFELGPGDGIYVPVHAPHLVRNGAAVSVSLSITWQTPRTVASQKVHVANAGMRRVGLSPRAPGASAGTDRAKVAAARVGQRVGRLIRRG